MEHTNGPWIIVEINSSRQETIITTEQRLEDRLCPCCEVETRFDGCDFEVEQKANARRIVACVNACEGLSDKFLLGALNCDSTPIKSLLNGYSSDNYQLQSSLKFLLDEATRTRDACLDDFGIGMINESALSEAANLIDKIEGGK